VIKWEYLQAHGSLQSVPDASQIQSQRISLQSSKNTLGPMPHGRDIIQKSILGDNFSIYMFMLNWDEQPKLVRLVDDD
jgi:hypothetical protein